MKSFTKIYNIKASKKVIYNALTNSSIIEKWSGSKTIMTSKNGSTFSLWDGSIHGKNIKISKNEIIQDWKEENWIKFSQVSFKIIDKGYSCQVLLTHNNIPDKSFKSIKNGWDKYYMKPLIKLVENK